MLDSAIIKAFREEVNTTGWSYFKYRNKNNRNQWNCICSAMDWIDVAVEYINTHPLESIGKYGSIDVYAYLTCVDIIVEAVEQLCRVIYSNDKYIFDGERECFNNNPFAQDDRTYFKTLRACFGAHPVNLQDPEDREAKRFASWSGGYFGSDNFSVILYSNKVDGKHIFLGMNFTQINRFLAKYYEQLRTLRKELRKQYVIFCEDHKKKKIEYSADPIKQLQILKEENCTRLNNDIYRMTIDELLQIFQTPISCEENIGMVQEFKKYLDNSITEIYNNLQNMSFNDLSYDPVSYASVPNCPDELRYALGKMFETVFGCNCPEFLWINTIEHAFEDKFIFQYQSVRELYVLVLAAIHQQTETSVS